ncbi:hypothetical protein O6H91_06G089100 [Diphasiastrum complanatum]|uniref:Uncharacterized protein n=7 Tax=Diphasiastrum complanatum TaxID=34168 RepID=A0ACC2DG46_DIPCM|nr:hypothetical protein O6H91_06G089100 [Diphasiastrum complanatum]KAJ7553228.1 hypothetical protein O6H91_06G089100 [Diphasiastrum complanatum]KAJ7553229.1 hypothetical protein O6H91_06G089100 [Diphasiastrum complanatum]KAJ7553230.1 hypothetical protein O6H91_06G089100 [Diphasiastrum complanatum]KAJ7553231.1 hypothetical protein O6H91_06G089100 [Diphasiastrum complanatum]
MLKGRKWRASFSVLKDALASVHTYNSRLVDWPAAASARVPDVYGLPALAYSGSNSVNFHQVELSEFDQKVFSCQHNEKQNVGRCWFKNPSSSSTDGRRMICPRTSCFSPGASFTKSTCHNFSKLAGCDLITSTSKASNPKDIQFSNYFSEDYVAQMRFLYNDFPVPGRHAMELRQIRIPGRNSLWSKSGGDLRLSAIYGNAIQSKQLDSNLRTLGFNGETTYINSCGLSKVSFFSTSATSSLATLLPSKVMDSLDMPQRRAYSSDAACGSNKPEAPEVHDHSQRAVVTALWCNFLVLGLKCGVWLTTASHVMLAEAVHSLADLANQVLLAYGLISSKRAPDALHPYGYSKERFVWSLISAVGIFCLGSGATIVHGVANLWHAQPLENFLSAAIVIGGSMVMEGFSLVVAVNAVRKGAAAEGMKWQDYLWRGHDPTSVAVMMEDSAAVAGLLIAGVALTAASITGNPIWDPIGSILVGNLLGVVAIFLIQRNRHALLGRSMDTTDMQRVMTFLSSDPVVDAIYDCKSEVIGPGAYRFKAEIDFNGVAIVQNYLERAGRESWMKEFREAAKDPKNSALECLLAIYGEEVVAALGSEVDRLEKEIQNIVPGIRHVDIEAHNPKGALP